MPKNNERIQRLGEVLKGERERTKMSYRDLFRKSGIFAGNLHRMENGHGNITVATLLALCDAHGIKASTMLRRAGE